ncbi:MAG TPA: hypothetical protein VMS65_16730 [Polyangiaceae bacterium]|nr:hypothetical protein [Polyangiaceae bacterium]
MILVELSRPAPPSIRRSSWLVRALVAGTFLTASSTAWGRPEFPGVVQTELGGCPPPCTICHTSASPEGINAEQPFVNNLFAWAGTAPITEASLPGLLALDADSICINDNDAGCIADGMCTRPCDANNNGTSDIDDLIGETDPNPGEKSLVCPKYGCGASRIAPGRRPLRPLDGAASLVALGAVCMLVRRWRRT